MLSRNNTLFVFAVIVLLLFSFTLIAGAQIKVVTKEEAAKAKTEYDKLQVQLKQLSEKIDVARTNQDMQFYNKYKAEYDELKKQADKWAQVMIDFQEYNKAVTSVNKLYNDGSQATRLRRYDEALTKYNQCIQEAEKLNVPDLTETLYKAYYQKGYVLSRQREYAEAVTSYNKAITIDSQNYLAFYGLGNAQKALRKYNEAAQSLQKAYELNPSHAQSLYNLATIQSQNLKKKDDALATLEKLLVISSNGNESTQRTLSNGYLLKGRILYENRKFNEAVTPLTKATETNVANYFAHYFLSESYYSLGKYQEAINAGSQCAKHQKGFGGGFYVMGKSYKQLGDEASALKYLQRAIRDRRFQKNAQYEIELIKNKDKYTK